MHTACKDDSIDLGFAQKYWRKNMKLFNVEKLYNLIDSYDFIIVLVVDLAIRFGII